MHMQLWLIILIIIVSITIVYLTQALHRKSRETDKDNLTDICRGYLTDKEYLQHMIPHHQVAIDISKMHQKSSKWDAMQQILRQLIWTQTHEIHVMEEMLKSLPENDMSDESQKMQHLYTLTVGDLTKPNEVGMTDTFCDPHFFNPEAHMKHMEHMELTDKTYIEHMIPHHQVAVDMSKRLLQHTKSDFMIYLAYRIIQSQQDEIVVLDNFLSNSNNIFHSDIVSAQHNEP